MEYPGHYVAIFGGAVSGAEAAAQLSQRGVNVVVFEQNTLPYGKIEDGLPKWHAKLRDKEERIINEKMASPNVTYVPNTKLGIDIDFEEVAKNWGFSAVLLATGAWRDRPLPMDNVDQYVGKGLSYQNPFFYWYNHFHESDYNGTKYEALDDTIVVGGGLASIDVVKVLMMESVKKALKEKNIETNMFELERGINKVLEKHGLTLADLGLKGCTLYYRRREVDMPLSPMPTDTPEQQEKAQKVGVKILENAMKKYLFRFCGCSAPVDSIIENDRLVGLIFQKTKIEGGKVIPIDGEFTEIRGSQVISSIGSIPEMIKGIPEAGQTFKIKDYDSCQVEGYENVFALGNAVTGRGNIRESSLHGKEISQRIMDEYLGWTVEVFEKYCSEKGTAEDNIVEDSIQKLGKINLLPSEKISDLKSRIIAQQEKVGYDGNYTKWVEQHLPVRLEDIIETQTNVPLGS